MNMTVPTTEAIMLILCSGLFGVALGKLVERDERVLAVAFAAAVVMFIVVLNAPAN